VPRRISIRLSNHLCSRLGRIARLTGRSKSFHVRGAIVDQLPDLEDLYLARKASKRVAAGRERLIPLEDLERELRRHS
jgi:RHH-type rel operon transcriptional repressor/antitoxin RelB